MECRKLQNICVVTSYELLKARESDECNRQHPQAATEHNRAAAAQCVVWCVIVWAWGLQHFFEVVVCRSYGQRCKNNKYKHGDGCIPANGTIAQHRGAPFPVTNTLFPSRNESLVLAWAKPSLSDARQLKTSNSFQS